MTSSSPPSQIGTYLIHRLDQAGVRHLFGVPGDYVLDFLDQVIQSPIEWIGNCNELNAGYAADGYARMAGVGAAVVTYGVGGFSILNAVAGACAEQVPLVLISGAPPPARRWANDLVHHLTRDYLLQYDIFRKVTVDSAILINPGTAPDEIDRVLTSCLAHKRPVYFELPMGMAQASCRPPQQISFQVECRSDPRALAECIREAASLLDAAKNPVVLAGVEILRFGLAAEALHLIEHIELPFATTVSSKSVLPELHPQFIGIYQGGVSRREVREQIESSDCVLSLGVWMTDFDTGGFSMKIDETRMISANTEHVKIGYHSYTNVQLFDFITGLEKALSPRSFLTSHPAAPIMRKNPFHPRPEARLTVPRFFEGLNSFLDDEMILMVEPGDAICAAPELYIEEPENFLAQAYYLSIGYCVPASLGVSLARPGKRPVVLSGDGAFQMTAQEVSSLMRFNCNPVIFILNNDGYMIERKLHEDGVYNDVQNWRYHVLPAVFGDNAIGLRVETEGQLEEALDTARNRPGMLILINLCFPPGDCSSSLEALGARFQAMSAKK